MANIDDQDAIRKLDPKNVLASTGLFADQCQTAWTEASAIDLPSSYRSVRNIVVSGMGGSRFTPKTVKELYLDRITVPYEIVDDYRLPAYVSRDTCVILSTYSGTTEEVLTVGQSAIEKGAHVLFVSRGGTLVDLAEVQKLPQQYFFQPVHNPCGQPRIGGGYMLFGHLGVLKALGVLDLTDEEVGEAIGWVQEYGKTLASEVKANENPAKILAGQLRDTHPFIITAEFLRGFGNGFANQLNETAKLISDPRNIPELNHHLMEGLARPDSLHDTGVFVFVTSDLYSDVIRKRFAITKDVVGKQKVRTMDIHLTGPTKLAQVLEGFTLSGYTTFYLAMLYDTDPVAIPWVDYFKNELNK